MKIFSSIKKIIFAVLSIKFNGGKYRHHYRGTRCRVCRVNCYPHPLTLYFMVETANSTAGK